MQARLKKLYWALAASVFGVGSAGASVPGTQPEFEPQAKATSVDSADTLRVAQVGTVYDIDEFLRIYSGSGNAPVIRQRKVQPQQNPVRQQRTRRGEY